MYFISFMSRFLVDPLQDGVEDGVLQVADYVGEEPLAEHVHSALQQVLPLEGVGSLRSLHPRLKNGPECDLSKSPVHHLLLLAVVHLRCIREQLDDEPRGLQGDFTDQRLQGLQAQALQARDFLQDHHGFVDILVKTEHLS